MNGVTIAGCEGMCCLESKKESIVMNHQVDAFVNKKKPKTRQKSIEAWLAQAQSIRNNSVVPHHYFLVTLIRFMIRAFI